jgi:hypothetical protein
VKCANTHFRSKYLGTFKYTKGNIGEDTQTFDSFCLFDKLWQLSGVELEIHGDFVQNMGIQRPLPVIVVRYNITISISEVLY